MLHHQSYGLPRVAPAPRRGRGLKQGDENDDENEPLVAPAPRRGRGLKRLLVKIHAEGYTVAPAPRRGRGLKLAACLCALCILM